jgi:hypothetical protein
MDRTRGTRTPYTKLREGLYSFNVIKIHLISRSLNLYKNCNKLHFIEN